MRETWCTNGYTLNNAKIIVRIWVADGSHVLDSKTLLKDVNIIYTKLGYPRRITGKSAKVLGVSLAFSAGLSEDDIRILGRWKSADTARHYRSISPEKLLSIGASLTQATMPQGPGTPPNIGLDNPVQILSNAGDAKPQGDTIVINTAKKVATNVKAVTKPIEFIKLFKFKTGWIKNPKLDDKGFPIPLVVPNTRVRGENELELLSSKTTVIKIA